MLELLLLCRLETAQPTMKRFLLLPRYAQDHILLCLQEAAEDTAHSGALPPTAPTRLGPRQRNAWLFPGHCQRSWKQPHDGAEDLQKKAKHLAQLETTPRAEASRKRPCTQTNGVRTKRFPSSSPSKSRLFFTPHSKNQTNLFGPNKAFPSRRFRHQLETIWQKQSSKQCQLRKILLPTTSPAPLKLAAHTLFSALSFSALGTILSLPSPRVRIQRQRHQGLLTH